MELNKLYTIRCHFNINIILYNHFKFEWSSKFNHLIWNHFFYNQLRIDVQALISLKSSWLKGDCMNHTVWYLMVMILQALRNVYQTIGTRRLGPDGRYPTIGTGDYTSRIGPESGGHWFSKFVRVQFSSDRRACKFLKNWWNITVE